MALARAGASEGYWLRADVQSGGRGRQGRQWQSPVGNLYASTLVRLRAEDPSAASLAFVIGIAAHVTLAPLGGPRELKLKWPNDLLLNDAKCAGMLLEREKDAVVLGIGVNLASAPEIAGRLTASFDDRSAAPFDPAALLVDLARNFAERLARWRAEPLQQTLADWESRAHAIGTPLSVSLGADEKLEGRYDGLASDGALFLRMTDGTRRQVHAADVDIIRERI